MLSIAHSFEVIDPTRVRYFFRWLAGIGSYDRGAKNMVMNIEMPSKAAVMTPRIQFEDTHPNNIIVISVYKNEADLMSAIKPGSKGFILNNSDPHELAQALIQISNESTKELPCLDMELPVKACGHSSAKKHKENTDNDLSKREEEVLLLVSKGASNKEIASTLFISENTVKTHLRNIMNKLGVVNRSQAAVYAVKGNLVHG